MAIRDEIIRLVLETKGEKEAAALSKAFDQIAESAKDAESPASKLIAELDKLGQTSKNIQGLISLKAQLAEIPSKLDAAKVKLTALQTEFAQTENPTRKLTKELANAEKAVVTLAAQQNRLQVELVKTQGSLAKAGVDTNQLAQAEQKLAAQSASVVQQIKQLGTETAKAGSSAEKAVSGFKKAGESVLSFGKNLLSITGIAGLVSSALAAISGTRLFSGTVQDAAKVEASLSRVKALAGATQEQFANFGSAVNEAAKQVNVSTETAAAALAALAEQGQSADQAVASLVPTLQLAKIAGIDVAQAAGAVDDALDLFGLSANDAARVVDVLTVASKGAKEGLGGITTAFSSLAPLAKEIGLSFEDTASILGFLAQNGISAEKAAKGLRSVFSELQDPTSKLRQELLALGDGSGNFGKAIETLASSGDKGKQALLGLEGTSRSVVSFLLQNGTGALDAFRQSIDQAGGSATRTAGIIDENLSGSFNKFLNTIGRLTERLVEPILTPLTEQFNSLSARIQSFSESTDFTKLQTSIKEFVLKGVEAFKSFIASVDFSKLAENISLFLNNTKGSFETFRENISGIVKTIVAFAQGVTLAFNTLKTGVFAIAALITQVLSATQDALEKFLRANMAAKIAEKFGFIAPAVKEAEDAVNGLGAVSEEFAKRATNAANDTQEGFESLKKTLEETTQAASNSAESLTQVSTATEALEKNARGAADPLGLIPDYLNLAGSGAIGATNQFNLLAPALEKTADSSEKSANAFRNQQRALIDARANVVQARDALIRLAESGETNTSAFQAALQTWQKAQAELDGLKAKSKPAADGAKRVEDAIASLGKRSQDELEKAAVAAKTNFDAISQNAFKSSKGLADARTAFEDYANAALAAVANLDEGSKANVAASLRSQAAALGLSDSLEELIQKFLKLGGTSGGATKQVADNMQSAASATKSVAANANDATDNLNKTANAAKQTKQETDGIQGSLGALTQITNEWYESFKQVSQEAGDLFNSVLLAGFSGGGVGGGFQRYIESLKEASKIVTETIAKQRAELNQQVVDFQNLGNAGVDAFDRIGGVSEQSLQKLEQFSNLIKEGNYDAGLLGQQELAPLQSAIDSAANRMRSLIDAAKGAADQLASLNESLQDEIDRSSGNETAIENRRYEQQIKNIKNLYEQSGSLGRKDYEEALRRADELHARKLKQLEEEARAREQNEKRTSGNQSSSSTNNGKTSRSGGGSSYGGVTYNNTYNLSTFGDIDPKQAEAIAEKLARPVKKQLDAIAFRSR